MNRRGFLAFLIGAPLTRSLPWQAIASIAPAPIAAQIHKTLAEMINETLRARAPELAANVMANNALLRKMKERGIVKPFTGGYVYLEEEEE